MEKRSNKKKQFVSRDQVLEQFYHELFECQPTLTNASTLRGVQPQDHCTSASASAASSSTDKRAPITTNLLDGSIDEASVRARGYQIGVTVKKASKDSKDLYTITEFLSDGKVVLDSEDASLTCRIPLAQLLDEFRIQQKKVRFLHDTDGDWATQILKVGVTFEEQCKAWARLAMTEAFDVTAGELALQVMTRPDKKVFSKQQYAAGDLKITVVAPSLFFAMKSSDISWPKVALFKISTLGSAVVYATYKLEDAMMKAADGSLQKSKSKDQFIHPFWTCRETMAPNMALSHMSIDVQAGASNKVVVKVPMTTNTKIIRVGDELMAPIDVFKLAAPAPCPVKRKLVEAQTKEPTDEAKSSTKASGKNDLKKAR